MNTPSPELDLLSVRAGQSKALPWDLVTDLQKKKQGISPNNTDVSKEKIKESLPLIFGVPCSKVLWGALMGTLYCD